MVTVLNAVLQTTLKTAIQRTRNALQHYNLAHVVGWFCVCVCMLLSGCGYRIQGLNANDKLSGKVLNNAHDKAQHHIYLNIQGDDGNNAAIKQTLVQQFAINGVFVEVLATPQVMAHQPVLTITSIDLNQLTQSGAVQEIELSKTISYQWSYPESDPRTTRTNSVQQLAAGLKSLTEHINYQHRLNSVNTDNQQQSISGDLLTRKLYASFIRQIVLELNTLPQSADSAGQVGSQ